MTTSVEKLTLAQQLLAKLGNQLFIRTELIVDSFGSERLDSVIFWGVGPATGVLDYVIRIDAQSMLPRGTVSFGGLERVKGEAAEKLLEEWIQVLERRAREHRESRWLRAFLTPQPVVCVVVFKGGQDEAVFRHIPPSHPCLQLYHGIIAGALTSLAVERERSGLNLSEAVMAEGLKHLAERYRAFAYAQQIDLSKAMLGAAR